MPWKSRGNGSALAPGTRPEVKCHLSKAAGQAAPALPRDPGGPGFKRSAVMLFGLNFPQAVFLLFSGCQIAKHVLVVVGICLLMLPE